MTGPTTTSRTLAALLGAALGAGCAGTQTLTRGMEARAMKAGVGALELTPLPAQPGQWAWTATASYHPTTTFLDALGRSQPSGCSLRLAYGSPREVAGAIQLTIAGVMAPEGAPGSVSCVKWHRLVAALDGLADGIPREVWVTELRQEGEVLTLDGRLLGTVDALDGMLAALEGSRGLTRVRLVSASPASRTGQQEVVFQVEARLAE